MTDGPPRMPVKAFLSYKWESEAHSDWVRKLAVDLRNMGVEAILDQFEVRYGDSFTSYMQQHINAADVILFVITPAAVVAAEAAAGDGGALKFEVQMMSARRNAEGTRIIGIYRAGDRPPHYLRDHRYADFRDDNRYAIELRKLADDLMGRNQPPPVKPLLPESSSPGSSGRDSVKLPSRPPGKRGSVLTTCPKCTLRLVATAEDLRVAQGYVRCGRCENVFNALSHLVVRDD